MLQFATLELYHKRPKIEIKTQQGGFVNYDPFSSTQNRKKGV
jgi:hypothetical protein